MQENHVSSTNRLHFLNAILIMVFILFIGRLFYLQVIRHDYYSAQAEGNQLRSYDIPADRGAIFAIDGGEAVPLVLNELRYNIVADPEVVKNADSQALVLAEIVQQDAKVIQELLTREASRYEIIAKKQTKEVKLAIEEKVESGELRGVFTEKVIQRVYPHGATAAQLLGFVNDEGKGNYGIEQALNDELDGDSGRVKALTDQNGIPLLASGENIQEDPVDGRDVTLTIDIAMQQQLEKILKEGLDNAISDSGSAIIMDPNTGAVKAIANYPSYNPADFTLVEDAALFTNQAVSEPLEPGSIMKVLTAAAALDLGVVHEGQTYFDPSFYTIDGAVVSNIAEDGGAATRSVSDILQYSLNTGATWLLMQMGGGEINEQARVSWHDYMVDKYGFGQLTGIEQGYEAPGYIPSPTDGFGLGIQYANTSFGQGMTVTPLQMAAALSAVINGGTYYQPHLVASTTTSDGTIEEKLPEAIRTEVVSSSVGDTIIRYMNNVVEKNNRPAVRAGYQVGGKTGTAEIANPAGGYFEDKFNGTYLGYVGGDRPEYVIIVRVNEPQIAGYAGSRAAGPVFASISNMLIDNFSVQAITNQ